MDRPEGDPYSTDDEERRFEKAVGHYIDQALANGHEAGEDDSVAGLDKVCETPQELYQYGRGGNRDQECDDDLFGDETQAIDHTSDSSNDAMDDGSWQMSPSPSSGYHSPSISASTNTPRASTSALMLPSGTGTPMIYSTMRTQPQNPKPTPPSHLPRRLSGNDYRRLRIQREAEYKEAQEKLRRGEITSSQMPAPIRQRMSKRRKALLKEQKELEGAVWKVRSDSEAVSACSSPATVTRGGSLEGAQSVGDNEDEDDDDDDDVRALALSAWNGSRRTSAATEAAQPSTGDASPTRACSSLPLPLFPSPAAAAASPSVTSAPRTLLNIVLKPGPEQEWTAAAAAMHPLPLSPCRTPASAPFMGSDNTLGRSREHSAMAVSAHPQSSVSNSRRDFASGSGNRRITAQHHRQETGHQQSRREHNTAAISASLPTTKAPCSLSDSIPKASSLSPSPYTAPLRRALHSSRQRIAAQVQTYQTAVNRLKLEADVLRNASRVVDSRILDLERRKRKRIMAGEEARRSMRDGSDR
ncbi:hypothetical protein BCV69DRAFT_25707 [Microstroma glucosiphilum]|uniref:Uncharacterized protein n=1 Tax=Pseudomicrostroma glucosiphilum TaxID=1684307 RepID=A0A316UGH6_9BASI|nr:hypothetical protein BCV69DRAFT_25707 [Pseudomicrostroma glucosiphilum]PWN24310.1 hypothetical protein BCV69DRAFT_25707 [Pseudomicrostroma glucosiphilum]